MTEELLNQLSEEVSDLSYLLADKEEENEKLKERVAELEDALRPFGERYKQVLEVYSPRMAIEVEAKINFICLKKAYEVLNNEQ